MGNYDDKDLQAAEAAFKRRLLELGLLTKIAPPATPGAGPRDRQPVPVAGNAVSELIIKERRYRITAAGTTACRRAYEFYHQRSEAFSNGGFASA